MMLLAWNYQNQSQGRNGDITETGGDSMADLWASYHSALGLGSKPPKAPTPMATGHSSPIHIGSATPGAEQSNHDETSSSDRTKDDDDGGASDDDSDDRMFVRLFVDENLDRIVPISKQPKEKIQAIIDSCTRQFPEFAERARKRIRTYLKSCRRNKKVRGEPASGAGAGSAWDTAVRVRSDRLVSLFLRRIVSKADAGAPHLGAGGTHPGAGTIDTTSTSAVASSFLSMYSGAVSSPATPVTSTTTLASAGHSKMAADTTRPACSPTIEGSLNNNSLKLDNANGSAGSKTASKMAADTTRPGCSPTIEGSLNNNSLKLDNANGSAGSKTASPASSPAPLFRPSFPNTFGSPQTFAAPTLHSTPAATNLTTSASSTQSKSQLLSHKLSGAEVGAVRQLITGYRESAAFLLRSADELEALLLNQP
ncbi:Uncharacterized protein OBRU01_16120 [Operophtera brumata]|uniref:Nucleolar protein 4 helical domain-containing protein n=1 Tax=Operophtera brumata TaxID=104452 RepID=A0A0L7L3V5_OPEBR|nr:Uncharacterized protein OBRU01_16120 [Operophtera brumata]